MFLPRIYSHYSLLSAVSKIPNLISLAKAKGYSTICLADEDTTSGFVEFLEECKKQEVKGVLGVTLRVPTLKNTTKFDKIVLIAKNFDGYQSLLRLVTIARIQKENPKPHLDLEDIQKELIDDNLLVIIPTIDTELNNYLQNGNKNDVENFFKTYLKYIPYQNLLVEFSLPEKDQDYKSVFNINQLLLEKATKFQIRTIFSSPARYLEKEDEEAFRVLLAIRDQVKLSQINLFRDYYLFSKEELQNNFSQFSQYFDTKDIENSIDIKVRTDFDKHAEEAYFPKFSLPEDQTASNRLTWETYIGLAEKMNLENKNRKQLKEEFTYQKLDQLKSYINDIDTSRLQLSGYPEDYWEEHSIKEYLDRIEFELDIIINKGYSDYFLIFQDIMDFCRNNSIVTNARGSVAGSIVAYLNHISVIDSIRYKVPFERFLNPFRPSPPDIDGDFADDRREEVIRYIIQKYGQENVSQIVTFGTMLPRAAVRDVGRVLGVSYKKCDRLSKLIPTAPQGKKTTFNWAFETNPELKEVYEKDPESQRIIDISRKIEGNHRHASIHAAGLIIAPTKITDYVSLQWDADHKMVVAQYDMRNCEKIGLVKMDILGIRNLSILGNAIILVEKRHNKKIDLLNLDLEDKKAFEMLSKGRTIGIFQLSRATMTKYLVDLEPSKVQDLMAMVALYRPGPMANIPEYIKRKKNTKLIKYYTPKMSQWMEDSYGILVYQDDLLYTVINIAGYNWLDADTFRKGVGKKIPEVIESQHEKFVKGAQTYSGLTEKEAEDLWQIMVPFAAYGFNKAHSSSYGMVSYWTAYMKANYKVEFMTALMTSESNDLTKIAEAIEECRQIGVAVLPPDVNKSFDNFSIEDNNTIRYGLASVKNLGSDTIKYIIEDRQKKGIYKDLDDFLNRVSELKTFNKKSIEALIASGCLDDLGKNFLETENLLINSENI